MTYHPDETGHPQCPAVEAVLEGHRDCRADEGDAVGAEGELERVGCRHAGLLEEVRLVALDDKPDEGLGAERERADLRAAAVNAAQHVGVGSAEVEVALEADGVLDKRDRLLVVDGLGREASHGRDGVVDPSPADKPPGGLGAEDGADNERDRPHPLQSERNAPPPLALVVQQACLHPGADQVPDDPAEVDVRRAVVADSGGHDFDSVGWGNDVQHTPWQTAQEHAGHNHALARGCEGERHEARERDERDDHDLLVPEPVDYEAVEPDANDNADRRGQSCSISGVCEGPTYTLTSATWRESRACPSVQPRRTCSRMLVERRTNSTE